MTQDQRSGLLWSWNPLFDLPRVMNQRTQGGQEKKEKCSAKQRKWEKVKGSKTRGDNYDRCDESVRHDIKSRDRWQTGNSQKKQRVNIHMQKSTRKEALSLTYPLWTLLLKHLILKSAVTLLPFQAAMLCPLWVLDNTTSFRLCWSYVFVD